MKLWRRIAGNVRERRITVRPSSRIQLKAAADLWCSPLSVLWRIGAGIRAPPTNYGPRQFPEKFGTSDDH